MSKSSIYETAWLDLVFEGKNKEYGAYQLRQENAKTTAKALFAGLLLIAGLSALTLLLSSGKTVIPPPVLTLGPTVDIVDVIDPVKPPKQEPPKTNSLPPTALDKPKPSISKPVVVEKQDATAEIPVNADLLATTTSPAGVTGGTGTAEVPSTGAGEATNMPEATNNSTYTAATVDKMPTYPGGMADFYKLVGRNFKTPEMDLTTGSTVRVLVSFVIEKDGTMTDIKVNRNPGYGLDKEAIRVLKAMKVKWEPGSIKGQPVRVVYSLPIAVTAP